MKNKWIEKTEKLSRENPNPGVSGNGKVAKKLSSFLKPQPLVVRSNASKTLRGVRK